MNERTDGAGRLGSPARPPFPFRMAAPAGWHVLRGGTASLRDDLVALVARSALWAELDDRRRRGTATLLEGVARASAATGAVATLLDVGAGPREPFPASRRSA